MPTIREVETMGVRRMRPLGGASKRLILGLAVGLALMILTWFGGRLIGDASAGQKPSGTPGKAAVLAAREEPAALPPIAPGDRSAKRASTTRRAPLGGRPQEEVTSPITVVLALLGVVATMIAVLVLLGRWMKRARLAPGSRKELKLLDAVPLGKGRHVQVLGFRDRVLILGSAPERVTLLAEYAEDEWSQEAETAEAAEVSAPRTRAPARPRAATDTTTHDGVDLVLSNQSLAKAREPEGRKRMLEPGAQRVPKAFRHLLEEKTREEEVPA